MRIAVTESGNTCIAGSGRNTTVEMVNAIDPDVLIMSGVYNPSDSCDLPQPSTYLNDFSMERTVHYDDEIAEAELKDRHLMLLQKWGNNPRLLRALTRNMLAVDLTTSQPKRSIELIAAPLDRRGELQHQMAVELLRRVNLDSPLIIAGNLMLHDKTLETLTDAGLKSADGMYPPVFLHTDQVATHDFRKHSRGGAPFTAYSVAVDLASV